MVREMSWISGIAKIAAIAVVGPIAIPVLLAGDMGGIVGCDGGCDEQQKNRNTTTRMSVTYRQRGIDA